MQSEGTKRQNLYSAKNIAQATVHYLLQFGVATGAFMLGENWSYAVGAGLTTVGMGVSMKYAVKHLQENLKRHPENHKYSPNLQYMVDMLYKASGLETDKNLLYDFKSRDSSSDKKKGAWIGEMVAKQFDKMANVPNAAAANLTKPVIIISEPLLELLDDDEEYAVLGHEFVHAKAEHQKVSMPHKILGSVSKLSNVAMQAKEYVESGWGGVIAGAIGMIWTNMWFKNIMTDGDLIAKYKKKKKYHKRLVDEKIDMTPEEIQRAKKLTKISNNFSSVVSAGAISAINPRYAIVYGAVKGLNMTAKLGEASLSRRFEFQADRGAVILGADPLALATSLRKIEAVYRRSLKNAIGYDARSSATKLLAVWRELNSTHPRTERRVKRLCKIARKAGFEESRIEEAATGEIDITHIRDIPHDVIEAMMYRFHMPLVPSNI